MHQPETWGYLQFSENTAGQEQDLFIYKEEEEIKWGLRQLYFQQRECKRETGTYGNDIGGFTIPDIQIENYTFAPDLIADSSHFDFRTTGIENNGHWTITQTGRVWFEAD